MLTKFLNHGFQVDIIYGDNDAFNLRILIDANLSVRRSKTIRNCNWWFVRSESL